MLHVIQSDLSHVVLFENPYGAEVAVCAPRQLPASHLAHLRRICARATLTARHDMSPDDRTQVVTELGSAGIDAAIVHAFDDILGRYRVHLVAAVPSPRRMTPYRRTTCVVS